MGKASDYIAVFDSGVGGISVLRKLLEVLPNERYLYFGDSANAPYGTRPREEVEALTLAAADKLAGRGIKAFVIACNTATSAAFEAVQAAHPEIPVIGIEPVLGLAAEKYPGGHAVVMATPGTLAGQRFLNNQKKYGSVLTVTPLPAPGLMELVEAEKQDTPEGYAYLRKLLSPYVGKIDALVLGCTHYPFVQRTLLRILGHEVEFFDGAVKTAQETKRVLEERGLLYDGPGEVLIENSLAGERMLNLSYRMAGIKKADHCTEDVLVIGIAGGSGSGKTTLMKNLVERFGDSVTVLSHDNYYKRHDELTYEQRCMINYDEPAAFETELMAQHLDALRRGESVLCPVYDYTVHNRSDKTVKLVPKPVIIVEGILIFENEPLRELMDIRIFVDTDADVRLCRRIKRDVNKRGRTLESVLTQYQQTVKPMHEKYVEPSKKYANLVVPEGGKNYVALDMIVDRIRRHLNGG